MSVVPVALSLLVTFTSSISLLGYATEMYVHGTQFWLYTVAFIIGSTFTAFVIAPMLYPLRLISIYEVGPNYLI